MGYYEEYDCDDEYYEDYDPRDSEDYDPRIDEHLGMYLEMDLPCDGLIQTRTPIIDWIT